MQPKHQGEWHLTSWSDFCRIVLDIIAEQSPCSQPTLFLIATSRGLQRVGDGSLGELKKLLARCVQDLKERGLVQFDGEYLVLASARSVEGEGILELTAELELHKVEDVLELTAELELHEIEDILELTAELELHEVEDTLDLKAKPDPHSPLPSSKLGEAPTQQKQVARGSEPTREEIIAAMRRFISDE